MGRWAGGRENITKYLHGGRRGSKISQKSVTYYLNGLLNTIKRNQISLFFKIIFNWVYDKKQQNEVQNNFAYNLIKILFHATTRMWFEHIELYFQTSNI
jgi:hypothetical protein